MKKTLALLIALAAMMSMSACNSFDPNKDDMTDEQFMEGIERLDELEKQSEREKKSSQSEVPLETIDPFENLTVTFSGTSPLSKVEITGGNSLCKYTADKESGVFNGDTVTVSAEFKTPQENKALSEDKREYTVEGLNAYAMKLDDIPENTLEKLRAQADDLITVYVCGSNMAKVENIGLEDYSFEEESREFVGYYFLSGKENSKANPYNKICCVYKMRYKVTAYEYDSSREGDRRSTDEHTTGYDEFYTLCELNDIILLEDGTCSADISAMKITDDCVPLSNAFSNYYGYKLNEFSYKWRGYSDIDSMFYNVITNIIDKYNYETTVE